MNPYAIGAQVLFSAIPEITKMFKGSQQRREADQLAKIKQPAYKIPTAAEEAVTRARFRAMETRLPGQRGIEERIGSATAGGQRMVAETAPSASEALNVGSALVGSQQNALGDLGISAANMYAQNQDKLTGQLGEFAGWQEKKQQWDVLNPYIMAKQRERELRNAEAVNSQRGQEGLFGSLSAGVNLLNQSGAFDNWKGGGAKSLGTGSGVGGINQNSYNFGGIDLNTPESFPGLNNAQKIQQFLLKNNRYPQPWELTQL